MKHLHKAYSTPDSGLLCQHYMQTVLIVLVFDFAFKCKCSISGLNYLYNSAHKSDVRLKILDGRVFK